MRTKRFSAVCLILAIIFTGVTVPIYASGGAPAQTVSAGGGEIGVSLNTGNTDSIGEIAAPELDLQCRAAVLACTDTGDILYSKEADTQCAIASITKVMTLLLTFEAIDSGRVKLTDTVPVSEHAYGMGGSQIWLEPGEIFTLDEMIKAICVSSANDAAVAVAEFIGGSETAFADMMNKKAAELGMKNTHFVNACGLDTPGHYSTAHDVAIMSVELMKHEKIMEYTNIWQDTLRGGETIITNTNKMLKSYNGITGLKTGTTGQAGVCISATATRNGLSLVAVVLGSPSSKDRFESAAAMLDYGFSAYEIVDFPVPSDLPQTVSVQGGASAEAELYCNLPKKLLVQSGKGADLSAEATVENRFAAPLAQGQILGKVVLRQGEEIIGEYPVMCAETVAKIDFDLAFRYLKKALFSV